MKTLHNVHPETACEGECCYIHNPSGHPLNNAPLNWRSDRELMERICAHGVGHPDPDHMAYVSRFRDPDGVHGCDGCCWSSGKLQRI